MPSTLHHQVTDACLPHLCLLHRLLELNIFSCGLTGEGQARLLLERLGGLGAGAAAAAKRRDWAEAEEYRMGRDRRAHQLALSQGRPVRARGQFLLSMA